MRQPVKKVRSVFKLGAFLGALLLAQPGFCLAADSDIYVPVNETVRLNEKDWYSPTNLTVEKGATLEIPGGAELEIGSTQNNRFTNYGTINVNDYAYVDIGPNIAVENIYNSGGIAVTATERTPDTANRHPSGATLYISGIPIFNKLMENGKILAGGEEAIDDSNLILRSSDGKFNLKTSDFNPANTLEEAKINKINLGDHGKIRFRSSEPGMSVTIEGDSLAIGPRTFDTVFSPESSWDESETPLATLHGGNHLTLKPQSNNTFTLTSGAIKAGSGVVNAPKRPSSLKIGDGEGTLAINGGMVRLGGFNTESGTVYGNVEIGNDKETEIPDSALIARWADWIITGDLTLNKSGFLRVSDSFKAETGKYIDSSLTVEKDFYFNGGKYIAADGKFVVNGTTHGSPDGVLVVRDSGKLAWTNIIFNGGQINFDPPFIADGDTSNASMGGLAFDSNNVDARINVGRNSMVTLGDTDYEWLRTQIGDYQTKNNLLWGRDITAALAVRTPQTLAANGGINVDGK